MMLYEKPDPTRYPNTQTRPDPKPEKVQPATLLLNRDKSEIVSDKTTNDIIRKELRRLDSTNEEFYNKI